MCGIAGALSLERPLMREGAAAALALLVHRGPDATGEWTDGAGRTWLGAQRLAIIDLRREADQPMRVGPLVIVHNGEIYDHFELRAELEGRGHVFRTRSDTEVIAAAYLAWGESMVTRLNGMFATAIWDTRDRSLFLCRDRFGEKPLYYAEDQGTFMFASEPKAVLALRGGPAVAEPQVLLRYLATGDVADGTEQTFFAGVRQLPAASCATVTVGQPLRHHRYWSVRPGSGSASATADDLVALMEDSLRLRRRADVPVGATLSGGVDSSLIVALAARGGPLSAFVVSTGGRDDEVSHARRSAGRAGVPLQVVELRAQDLKAEIDDFVWHQDEPVPHTSQLAHWALLKAVQAAGLKVLLEGQGSDEMFGGYHAPSLGGHWNDLARRGRLVRVVREIRSYARRQGVPVWRPLGFLAGASLPAAIAARARQSAHGLGGALVERASPRPADHATDRATALASTLATQTFSTSLPSILRYVDRNSMAHSVEVRLPFLDHRIAELAAGLPSSALIADGQTKWIVRQALRRVGLTEAAERHDKIGFATPEGEWLRGPLREWAHEHVMAASRRAYYRPGAVEAAWHSFLAGRLGTAAIWRIAHAEAWTAAFIEGRAR